MSINKEASKIKKAINEFLALIEDISSKEELIEAKKNEIISLLEKAKESRNKVTWVIAESKEDIGPFGCLKEVK